LALSATSNSVGRGRADVADLTAVSGVGRGGGAEVEGGVELRSGGAGCGHASAGAADGSDTIRVGLRADDAGRSTARDGRQDRIEEGSKRGGRDVPVGRIVLAGDGDASCLTRRCGESRVAVLDLAGTSEANGRRSSGGRGAGLVERSTVGHRRHVGGVHAGTHDEGESTLARVDAARPGDTGWDSVRRVADGSERSTVVDVALRRYACLGSSRERVSNGASALERTEKNEYSSRFDVDGTHGARSRGASHGSYRVDVRERADGPECSTCAKKNRQSRSGTG
jgi:hypothetical protein